MVGFDSHFWRSFSSDQTALQKPNHSPTMTAGCSLECFNEASCAFDHNNEMYCECTWGYSGLQCNLLQGACDENEHPCYNGARCVRHREMDSIGGKATAYCDCSTADPTSGEAYAGHFCEHESTVFCTVAVANHVPKHTFCTNGGSCKKIVNANGK